MEIHSDSDSEIPRKCSRTEGPTNECIICGEHGSTEQFYHPKNEDSWRKLLEAATLHQFEKLIQIKTTLVFQIFIIIQSAEKTFCHKKSLAKIKKQQSSSCVDDESKES